MRLPIPKESDEQTTVCQWLDYHKVLYCAVPNGGTRHAFEMVKMLEQGVKPGVPDLLIFTPSPRCSEYRGVAIEMKRLKRSVHTQVQKDWAAALIEAGWFVEVCKGADAAIQTLERLGYGR